MLSVKGRVVQIKFYINFGENQIFYIFYAVFLGGEYRDCIWHSSIFIDLVVMAARIYYLFFTLFK